MTPLFLLFLVSSIFIPTDHGYDEIPVVYAKLGFCDGYLGEIKGCFFSYNEYKVIVIDPDHIYDPAYLGYNVFTHEVLHAWGYSHSEMLHLFVNEDMR